MTTSSLSTGAFLREVTADYERRAVEKASLGYPSETHCQTAASLLRIAARLDAAEDAGALAALCAFVAWHDDSDRWGGHRAAGAKAALCSLLGMDRATLDRIAGVAP